MRADVELGAFAFLALLDPNADPDDKMDGALLISGLAQDIHFMRRVFVKTKR